MMQLLRHKPRPKSDPAVYGSGTVAVFLVGSRHNFTYREEN
jgi:hypothetical protein